MTRLHFTGGVSTWDEACSAHDDGSLSLAELKLTARELFEGEILKEVLLELDGASADATSMWAST